MEDKYIRVIYESDPIGKYKIILRLTTFDIEAYKRDKEVKELQEKRYYERININPKEPLEIIERRLEARVDAFYKKKIESLRSQLEWYIRNTRKPIINFECGYMNDFNILEEYKEETKIIKNVTNSENIYCEIIQGNVVNCDNVHCKEIRGNIVNSEIIKE